MYESKEYLFFFLADKFSRAKKGDYGKYVYNVCMFRAIWEFVLSTDSAALSGDP